MSQSRLLPRLAYLALLTCLVTAVRISTTQANPDAGPSQFSSTTTFPAFDEQRHHTSHAESPSRFESRVQSDSGRELIPPEPFEVSEAGSQRRPYYADKWREIS